MSRLMHPITALESTITQLRSPLVRDLAWACFSQALYCEQRAGPATGKAGALNGTSMFAPTAQRLSELQALDSRPDKLQQHLWQRAPTRRLGVYFEHLVEFFIAHDASLSLAQRNLPVRHGGNTLGEFDFLYWDRSALNDPLLVHLEVAVKFYLGVPQPLTPGSTDRWLGPASHDSLERKIAKLDAQQSRLSEHPQAKQSLSDLGLPVPHVQRSVVNGMLFQPAGQPLPLPAPCPERVHTASWMTVEAACQQTQLWQRGLLLDKPQWLTPLPSAELFTRGVPGALLQRALSDYFKRSRFPTMLEVLPHGTRRSKRLFVVPDDWPSR